MFIENDDEAIRLANQQIARAQGMLTPEERADKIVKDENWYDFDYMRAGPDGDEHPIETIDRDVLRNEIAAAIRAAVEAERERCAQVAEEHAARCAGRMGEPEYADKRKSLHGGAVAAAVIAGVIRRTR